MPSFHLPSKRLLQVEVNLLIPHHIHPYEVYPRGSHNYLVILRRRIIFKQLLTNRSFTWIALCLRKLPQRNRKYQSICMTSIYSDGLLSRMAVELFSTLPTHSVTDRDNESRHKEDYSRKYSN